MGSRAVRLDEETELALDEIRRVTGLSISEVLKQGVLALRKELTRSGPRTPYDIYSEIDLGPGGYSIAPSTDTRAGARAAIRRKLGR